MVLSVILQQRIPNSCSCGMNNMGVNMFVNKFQLYGYKDFFDIFHQLATLFFCKTGRRPTEVHPNTIVT